MKVAVEAQEIPYQHIHRDLSYHRYVPHTWNLKKILFIDIFDRHGYTADSNAMLVGLLEEFASAELVAGNRTGAAALQHEAAAVELSKQSARARQSTYNEHIRGSRN